MLTDREWRQIKVAITAAAGYNIAGEGMYMAKQNMLAILQEYVDGVVFVSEEEIKQDQGSEEQEPDKSPPF